MLLQKNELIEMNEDTNRESYVLLVLYFSALVVYDWCFLVQNLYPDKSSSN